MTTLEPKTNVSISLARCASRPCSTSGTASPSLAQTVQAATRNVDGNTLRPVAPLDGGLACQPRTLLTVLTYCYARQTYGSAEVVARLRRDSGLAQFCHGELPDARTIRRFRRENREPLQRCLEAALRFVAEQKVAQGIVTRVKESEIAQEARRRIIMAMFVDSMDQDKDQTSDVPVDLCYLFANRPAQVH